MLDRALEEAGIPRTQVYVTNAVKRRPRNPFSDRPSTVSLMT
jgi:hypothetical protein